MRKIIMLAIFILVNSLSGADVQYSVQEPKYELTNDEKEFLKIKKTIKICVDPDWMPFEKIENSKHIGLAAEYIKYIQISIATPIELVETKYWKESVAKLKRRECDILSTVSYDEDKSKFMYFTTAFFNTPIVVATKNDFSYIEDLRTVAYKKIGIVEDYSAKKYLIDKYPNINLVEVKSVSDGLHKVENGKLFAFVDNLASLNYEIRTYFSETLKISARLDKKIALRIGVRNDEPLLKSAIEKSILSIDNKTKDDILNKWIYKQKAETTIDYTMLWQLSLVFIAIVSLVSWFLKREMILHKKVKKLNQTLEQRVKQEVQNNRKKDEQLIQQSRFAQMGEMLSMITHQWKQPLNAISATSIALTIKTEMDMIDKETIVASNKKIALYIEELSDTMEDFKNFFKPNRDKENVTYTQIIDSALSIAKISIEANNIKIISTLNNDNEFSLYKNELKQVVLNLIKNAEDALLEKETNNPCIEIKTFVEDGKNILRISDNAGGIPKDIIDKIFNPYFSTKSDENGTGLGLSMSKTIIQDHCGGKLSASNNKDGAVFKIALV